MKRSSTEGSFANEDWFEAAWPKAGLAGSSLAAPNAGLPAGLNGFELAEGAELAPGALNAELIGSVFVAAEGVAAGLGKLTEEFPKVLPPNPDEPAFDEGAEEGLG